MVANASSRRVDGRLVIGISMLFPILLSALGCANIVRSGNKGKLIDRELTRKTVEEKFSTAALHLSELDGGAIVKSGTTTQEIPIRELLENEYANLPFDTVILSSDLRIPVVNDSKILTQWCVENNVNLIDNVPHGRFDAPDFVWRVAQRKDK